MRAPRSEDEAAKRAAAISQRSRIEELSALLTHASNGAIVPALLRRHGLNPVYEWMRSGIEFDTIYRVIWIRLRFALEIPKVASWEFFAQTVKARHLAEQRELLEDIAALNRARTKVAEEAP